MVSEGALSEPDTLLRDALQRRIDEGGDRSEKAGKETAGKEMESFVVDQARSTERLAEQLEALTGLEARVTILGHVQRGGTPSPVDRLLATRLGTTAAQLVADGVHGVMVAIRDDVAVPVPLDQVAGKRRAVPLDHPWIVSAGAMGASMGVAAGG